MVWVKRLLIALAALVVVAALGVAALFAWVDPNDYKPALQQAVEERYQRTLAIDGDIRLSLFPRLALEISGVSLSEPGTAQSFAAMDTARVAVAWLPLLSRDLRIEHVSVTGLKANIVRNKDGHFNFNDLVAGAPAVIDDGASTSLPATRSERGEPRLDWNIAGVSIEGGELAVTDAASGTTMRVEGLSAQAQGIQLGEPFNVSATGRVLGQSPRADANLQLQAQMQIGPYAEQFAFRQVRLQLEGVLPSLKAKQLALSGSADLNLPESELRLHKMALALQGDVALATPLNGLDLQLQLADASADWAEGRIDLTGITGKAQGLLDGQPFTATLDAPRVASAESEPVELRLRRSGEQPIDLTLLMEGLSQAEQHWQLERVALQGELGLPESRRAQVALQSPVVFRHEPPSWQLPELKGQVDLTGAGLPDGGLAVPLNAAVRYAPEAQELEAQGQLALHNETLTWQVSGRQLASLPAWQINVKGGELNLDRWWPAAAPQVPTAPTAPPAEGGAASSDQPLWNPASFADLDVALTASFSALHARGVTARDVHAELRVAEGGAELGQLRAQIFGGSVQASGHATAGQQLALRLNATQVALEPLLMTLAQSNRLSGRGDIELNVQSVGLTEPELRQALNGNLRLQVRNGAVRGINVAQTLREFRALLGQEDTTQATDDSRTTDFSELQVSARIADGMATVTDLALAAPLVRLTQGEPARINLVQDEFDLVLVAHVVNTSTGQDGKSLEQLRGVAIPVHVTGPLSDPEYRVLWSSVGSAALGRVLQNEASRQLDRLLERQEDEPARALGEALKGLLGR